MEVHSKIYVAEIKYVPRPIRCAHNIEILLPLAAAEQGSDVFPYFWHWMVEMKENAVNEIQHIIYIIKLAIVKYYKYTDILQKLKFWRGSLIFLIFLTLLKMRNTDKIHNAERIDPSAIS